ncbi:hypothetical protein SteCoe_22149 [Stentor coeruleus]|uniref:Uncharacterized protein n=1 Tax=Stentor coeruleus TaxID=5963 RepID=A0A1R2BN54_9CILI|nr:hypothetical protein SteCoe_22149 [Stentor coeruleus]
MIQFSTSNSFILEFLSKYPENQRKTCAEAILLYGVRTIKNKFPYGLTSNQLISVAGLPNLNESIQRVSASCNISISNSKSLDIQKLLSESSLKNDENTERLRDQSYEKKYRNDSKTNSRVESENKPLFTTKLKEPEICPYETAKSFFFQDKNEESVVGSEVMKIAEEFLKNNYAVHLAKDNSHKRKS